MPHSRYMREEIARRGQVLYEQQIRAKLEARDSGKFLVVDIETGAYEIDTDELAAVKRMKIKHQDAALYILRIGHPTAYKLGHGHLAVR